MKNYITALIFIFFCSTAFAQTEKGSFVISGKTDMSFLFSKITTGTDSIQTGKTNSRQFNFTAGAGYFIANNLSLGLYGTYSYSYTKDEAYNYSQSITESFTVLPQLQYYIPIEGKLKPFAGIGGGYVWLQERDSRVTTDNNRVYSISGPAFAGVLGISYFITRSVSFDLNFQYTYSRLKDKMWEGQIQKEQQVGGNMGISVFF
jgi:outer membrane protein